MANVIIGDIKHEEEVQFMLVLPRYVEPLVEPKIEPSCEAFVKLTELEFNKRTKLKPYKTFTKCEKCEKWVAVPLRRHLKYCDKVSVCETFQCDHCNFNTWFKGRLKEHSVIHLKTWKSFGRPHCFICKADFSCHYSLKCHIFESIDHRAVRQTHPKVVKGHKCHRCGYEAPCSNVLGNHLALKPCFCYYCDEKFTCRPLLKEHYKVEHGAESNNFPCESCDKVHKIVSKLKDHQQLWQHGKFSSKLQETLNCSECPKQFSSKEYLRKHLKRCHRELFASILEKNSLKCQICHVSFKTRQRLNLHLDNHENVKTYRCKTCPFVTLNLAIFKAHSRNHRQAPRLLVSCRFCSDKFENKKSMQTHVEASHPEHHFYCDLCSLKFQYKFDIRYHMKVHMIYQDNFKCERCGAGFRDKLALNSHFKQKISKCYYCDSQFLCKALLTRHLSESHKVSSGHWPCDDCKNVFIGPYRLGLHQKYLLHGKYQNKPVEDFKCSECSNSYKLKSSLQKHLRKRHPKAHKTIANRKCHLCSVKFTTVKRLQIHLENHENIRVLYCDLCSYTTLNRDTLKYHMGRNLHN